MGKEREVAANGRGQQHSEREGETARAGGRRAGRPSRAGRAGCAEQAMRQAGPRPGRRGKEGRLGQFLAWLKRWEGRFFSKSSSFLFLVFNSKLNSNQIQV